MSYPTDLRYTTDHEWLRTSGATATVGITQFAVSQLGDIVLVDLPREGAMVTKGQSFGTIESVKSVSELYAPVSGTITKVNGALKEGPETINSDCYGDGWMVEIEVTDSGELEDLMNAEAYTKHTAE